MHPEFLAAVGRAVSSWGYYETLFVGHLDMLERYVPEVDHPKKTGRSFPQRAKRFRELVAIAFDKAPSIVAQLDEMVDAAEVHCDQRNILCHGAWIPGGPDLPRIAYWRKQQPFIYTVTTEHLRGLDEEICALYAKQAEMLIWAGNEATPTAGPWLTSDEKSALHKFRTNIRPQHPNPQAPKPRHEPFRASPR